MFILKRGPKGRVEGRAIEDYVVENYADHPLCTSKTQLEAIEWAKKQGSRPLGSPRSAPQR